MWVSSETHRRRNAEEKASHAVAWLASHRVPVSRGATPQRKSPAASAPASALSSFKASTGSPP